MTTPKFFIYTTFCGCDYTSDAWVSSNSNAVIIDATTVFSVDGQNSLLPLIEGYVKLGTPVFLISGQRGQYEQQVAKKSELIAIDAGAIPLGACPPEVPKLYEGLGDVFSQDMSLEDKIAEFQRRFYKPAIESEEFSPVIDFLFDGGSLEIGKFVYADYEPWLAVKNSEGYKPLSEASLESYKLIAHDVVPEMAKREIHDFYSMGPTPDIDKRILEECVRQKHKIRYHGIDISKKALVDTKKVIEEYLDSVDEGWRRYVSLVDEKPQLFQEVKAAERSCVSYPGGQLVNSSDLLSDATEICNNGGLVIADIHTRTSKGDQSELWKSVYDTEEEREMFRKAVLQIVPGLRDEEGWDIAVKYVQTIGEPDKISFQLEVDKEIECYCGIGIKVTMKPGVERELMMSKKYTMPEFRQEVAGYGFNVISERSVFFNPARKTAGKGFGSTVLLSYKGKYEVAAVDLKEKVA